MGTIILDTADITSLEIGDRLTKLRVCSLLVLIRNAGAMTFAEDDVTEGLHPAEQDTGGVRVGTADDAPAVADAIRALVSVGYPGGDARASIRAATVALGNEASIEQLVDYALRNRVRSYEAAPTVVGVQVSPSAIVAAVVHNSLTITLASGRKLAWKARPEMLTPDGLHSVRMWPKEACSKFVNNGETFVNCTACGGWRIETQCPHRGEKQ